MAAPRAIGKTPRRWLLAGTMAIGGWVSVTSCAVYGAPGDDDTDSNGANTSSSAASTGSGAEGGAGGANGAGGAGGSG